MVSVANSEEYRSHVLNEDHAMHFLNCPCMCEKMFTAVPEKLLSDDKYLRTKRVMYHLARTVQTDFILLPLM